MTNPTRRELAIMAAASLTAAKAAAQAPSADFYQAALESHKRNSLILAQFQIAMSVEPAFHFKA